MNREAILEQIIMCMADGSSDDGVSPERIVSWIEHKLGKNYATEFKDIAKRRVHKSPYKIR